MKINSVTKVSLSLLFSICFLSSFGQFDLYQRQFLELKIGVGGSLFLGDLGGTGGAGGKGVKDLDLSTVRKNTSVGLKINFSNRLSVRGDFFKATLYGDDALSGDAFRYNRNLSFRSDLTEVSATVELIGFNFGKMGKNKLSTAEVYFYAGAGWIKFNPQAQLNGVWYDLQPIGTEGQGIVPGKTPYSLNAMVIPFGVGYRKNILKHTYVGLEISLRKSFTDYIDDVSGTFVGKDIMWESKGPIAEELSDRNRLEDALPNTPRGNPTQNDNYSFVQITLAQGFGNKVAKQKLSKKDDIKPIKLKCPKFR